MDPTTKTQWLEALRGGAYKQGHNRLRYGNKFCCLGVLCDILGAGEWNAKQEYELNNGEIGHFFLPDILDNEIGLTRDQEVELSNLNDNEGKNFLEIATYIEENL